MEDYGEKFKSFIFDCIVYLEDILDKRGVILFKGEGRDSLKKFIDKGEYNFLRLGDKCIDTYIFDAFSQKAIPLKSRHDRRFSTFENGERSELIQEIINGTRCLHN